MRTFLTLPALVFLAATTVASAQDRPPPLFAEAKRSVLNAAQSERLRSADERVGSAGAELVLTPVIERAQSLKAITVNLPSEGGLVATRQKVEVRAPGVYSWFGTLEGGGEVILTVSGEDLHATIRTGVETYVIEPLGGGRQTLVKVDFSEFPDSRSEFEDGGGGPEVSPFEPGTRPQRAGLDHLMEPDLAT